jgi:hypothetical protein
MKSNCIYMVLISDSIQAIVSCIMYYTAMFYKNVREYRRGNTKWRETGNIGYIIRKKPKTQHNMCWTPLCASNTNNINKT